MTIQYCRRSSTEHMAFVKGKVAIVTGGAMGIGFGISRELLRSGVKGLTLVDYSPQGKTSAETLAKEFGSERVIFVKADVTERSEFEDAFKKTIETFQHVDILINNAGILNDSIWEREIAVNVKGTATGCILAIDEYIPKYKSGPEGVVVNLSSVAGIRAFPNIPIYAGTKHAIIGMSRSWGMPQHYERTKVRVLAVCPGATDTPLMREMFGRNLGEPYEKILQSFNVAPEQTSEDVGVGILKIIDEGVNGSVWVVNKAETYEVHVPNWPDMERKVRR